MVLTASFDVTGWDETAVSEPAALPGHGRATVRKRFHGALEAESVAELVTWTAADPADGAGYVASEVVTGTLDGKAGTFVVQHGGLMGAGTPPRTFGNVVPGSGTGALEGLAGTVEIARDADGGHPITLNVTLG